MPLILEIPLSPPSNAQNTEHSYSEKGRIGTKEGKKKVPSQVFWVYFFSEKLTPSRIFLKW